MSCTIFYSWQSQLPNSTNRGFIQKALEAAVSAVHEDTTIEARPEVDRDTANVPGSPNIADTIRAKIDAAEIVVCDVSIVQGLDGDGERVRPTPNPNVLIELGYAMKSLGTMERLILVMNTAYGGIEKLPFDLRQYRPTTYELPEGAENKAEARKALAAQLEKTLRHVLSGPGRHASSPIADAVEAVETSAPNAELRVKRCMEQITVSLVGSAPQWSRVQDMDEAAFIAGIGSTVEAVADFARLSKAVAGMNAVSCARALYDGLTPLVARCDTPRGYVGRLWRIDFDFFKILVHELIVILAAAAISDERWDLLDDVLRRELFVEYGSGPKALPFTALWGDVHALDQLAERTRRISVQADLLKERHTTGPLGDLVPMDHFVDADVLLFLRGELMQPSGRFFQFWFPHSTVYLDYRQPSYLLKGENHAYASRLLKAFGCNTLGDLRTAYATRRVGWGRFYEKMGIPPLLQLSLDKLGSR